MVAPRHRRGSLVGYERDVGAVGDHDIHAPPRAGPFEPPLVSGPESVSRFLVGGFMEVLRSWMEDPDSTDLSCRVGAALDTVNPLLGLTTPSKGPQHG